MAFSFGGNKSKSKSSLNQEVWGPQQQALQQLYGSAGQLYNRMAPWAMNMGMGLTPQVTQMMRNPYYMGGQGARHMMGGGSFGDTTDIRNALMNSMRNVERRGSNTGRMYEDIIGGKGNTYIDPLIDSMRTGAMERRDRMRAGTAADAAAAGQGGWSRHAVENAMADRRINQDLNMAENQLRAGAYDTDLNWKMDIARQADSNIQSQQDRMLRMMQGADQNVGGGMAYMPHMQNLGMGVMAPYMQAGMYPWQMMGAYAGAIGDPTVLSSGQQSGKSSGFGFGF